MRFNYIICIGFLAIVFLAPLYAQEVEENLEVYDLQDTIVVVADRFKLSLKDLTYTYQVIPEKEVRAISKHSSIELIDIAFPSAYTIDNKIMGYGVGREAAGAVNIRGQGGKPNTGMLVLLNGHPDFTGLFGHPIPDVYGFDDVQQVEILAGPTSSVFGSQAMGGTINIKTGPNYKHLVRVSAEAGNYNTYSLGVTVAKEFDQHGFFVTARHDHTDGDIPQSSFESYRLQGGWEYQINDIWHVGIQGRYIPFQFDEPTRDGDPANLGKYGKINRGTGEIIVENKGENISGSTQVFGNWGRHQFYDGFDSRDFTYGLSSYQQLRLSSRINIAIGGEFMSYGGNAENLLVPPGVVNNEKHDIRTAGLYGLMMYNPLHNLNLKLGFRYQYNSLPLENISPVAGITYSIIPGLQLYSNYQTGFRFPTVNELYLFPSSSSDLKEEFIRSIDGGVLYYWSNHNTIRFTVFNNYVENMIQLLPYSPPPPAFKYANGGEARQTGVEAQVNFNVFKGFDTQLSYSDIDPDELTAYNPKHQIKYWFSFVNGHFRSTLHGKYIDQLYALNNSEARLPDYNLLNLSFSYNFTSWLLNLRLYNILDRTYYVQPNFTAPGFYFLAGFEYSI